MRIILFCHMMTFVLAMIKKLHIDFFIAMHDFTFNQDVVVSSVRSEDDENMDKFGSLVATCHAAKVASVSARPKIGMLSPRKRVCEEDAAEAGRSSYLNELD